MYCISSTYFIHQIFILSEIWNHFYIYTSNFQPFQIWTFWPEEPKYLNFLKSFSAHYPQLKLNQTCPKHPELIIIILTMKLLYTYISSFPDRRCTSSMTVRSVFWRVYQCTCDRNCTKRWQWHKTSLFNLLLARNLPLKWNFIQKTAWP